MLQRPPLGPQSQLAGPTPQAPPNYFAMQPPAIPPPVTDPRVGQQIRQGFQQLDKPDTGPGDIAGAILRSPLTVPVGIIEELRGLMGGDTIQGWAQEARSRYNSPTFSETRAFGVQGNAEEPSFGDRFLGVVTGSAQRGALAGKEIRQQIGAYNAQRKAALRENKDVQQLQQGQLGIQGGFIQNERNARKNEIEKKYSDLQARLGIATSQLGLANTNQQMNQREIQIQKLQLELGITREKAESLVQQNDLFNTPGTQGGFPARGLTGPAADVPNLLPTTVENMRQAEAAGQAIRDKQVTQPGADTGLTPEQLALAARLEAAATAKNRTAKAQRNTAVDALRGARDPAGPNIDFLQELLGRVSGGSLGIPSQAADFSDYDAQTRQMQAEAYRSRGLPVPADLVSPTSTPMPGATPGALADRIDTMTPEDKAIERLQREAEAAVAPAVPSLRPTPIATPRPQGTTAMVDLSKAPPEADRQADATKEARLKEVFLRNWVEHEGWNSPRSGARWNSKWSAFMAANGL